MFDQMYDWNQYQEQDASSNGLARTLKGNKGGISPGSLSPLNQVQDTQSEPDMEAMAQKEHEKKQNVFKFMKE